MKVFNTLGRRYEEFTTRDPGKVAIYLCGPTVQSDPHVGHGRAAVAFDVIRRYLQWRGYEVTFVQNVTDVEDKIIAAAQERNVPVEELAKEMTDRFRAAYRALGALVPDVEPRATDHISEMQNLITILIERDHAYESGGDVYFVVRSFPKYGELSGHRIDELISGARVEPGEHKRDPLDFALWKAAKPGEPQWDSPWGPGRPGWHIECSAMSMKYLGNGFDIHGGGTDLIFPHHENEIAQSEGATGRRFARYWLHNGMVNLGGEKMAKSTGQVIGLEEAIDRFTPMAIRLFYLRAHYRTPQEYSEALLADAKASVERLWTFRRRGPGELSTEPDEAAIARFEEAMDDDFNTPEAVGILFDVVREGNRRIDAGEDAGPIFSAFDVIAGVLGLIPPSESLDELRMELAALAEELGIGPGATAEETVERLIAARRVARDERDWATADSVRKRLDDLGVVLEDTADGARWHRR
ncbi:MAG: cysteine--tRNA ligase [Actinobacteria bacterium]|nr:cysteine--tRNA ligase [Actinomycetota bacterium]